MQKLLATKSSFRLTLQELHTVCVVRLCVDLSVILDEALLTSVETDFLGLGALHGGKITGDIGARGVALEGAKS